MAATLTAIATPDEDDRQAVPFPFARRAVGYPLEPTRSDAAVSPPILTDDAQKVLDLPLPRIKLPRDLALQMAAGGESNRQAATNWAKARFRSDPIVRQKREVIDPGLAQIDIRRSVILEELRYSDSWRRFVSEYLTPYRFYVDKLWSIANAPAAARVVGWSALGVGLVTFDLVSLSFLLDESELVEDQSSLVHLAIIAGPPLAGIAALSGVQSQLSPQMRRWMDGVLSTVGAVLSAAAIVLTAGTLGSMHGRAELPGAEGAGPAASLNTMLLVNLSASVLAAKVCKSMAERAAGSFLTYTAEECPQHKLVTRDRRRLRDAQSASEGLAAALESARRDLDLAEQQASASADAEFTRALKLLAGRRAQGESELLSGDD